MTRGRGRLFKRAFFWIFCMALLPIAILVWIDGKLFRSEAVFSFFACLFSIAPGHIGCILRNAYYFRTLRQCSTHVEIGFGSFFAHRDASLGNFVYIGAYAILGRVEIADNVLVASRVSIPSGRTQHIGDELQFQQVRIGEHTWIGEGSIVMAEVGQNCIVGAGSVVTEPVPDNHVAVGSPARPVKKREE